MSSEIDRLPTEQWEWQAATGTWVPCVTAHGAACHNYQRTPIRLSTIPRVEVEPVVLPDGYIAHDGGTREAWGKTPFQARRNFEAQPAPKI